MLAITGARLDPNKGHMPPNGLKN